MGTRPDQMHTEITERIIGAAFKVHITLGPGFDAEIYHNALRLEMEKLGLPFENDWEIKVYYESVNIGSYKLDFLVQDKVIVHVLAVEFIDQRFIHQMKSHLAAASLTVGLILNFMGPSLEIKRVEPRELKAQTGERSVRADQSGGQRSNQQRRRNDEVSPDLF